MTLEQLHRQLTYRCQDIRAKLKTSQKSMEQHDLTRELNFNERMIDNLSTIIDAQQNTIKRKAKEMLRKMLARVEV